MNKIIKVSLFLAIVACLSGLSIGLVNNFTMPIINSNAIASEKENLELLFPKSEYILIDYKDDDGFIIGAYEVKDKGYVFKANATGYNPSTPITMLIAMDKDGKIVNILPLEHQETKGVGSKCFEEENVNKFYVGKTVGQNIDVLSGATFTSNAVIKMITKAQEAYGDIQ